MDFYLRYRGPLAANGDAKRKGAIREYLSPQIQDLFTTARQLKDVSRSWLRVASSMKNGKPELAAPHAGLNLSPSIAGSQTPEKSQLFYQFTLGRRSFIPLITRHHGLVCEIDLTFLRREDPGAIISGGGDLDNRLKTLFDALRIPYTADELGHPIDEQGDPIDVYCLPEDDLLITRLGLHTGRLLGPLHGHGVPEKENHVELHMHVFVKVDVGMIANLDFL